MSMSRFRGSALTCCLLLVFCLPNCLAQEAHPKPNAAEAKIFAALRQPTKLDFVDQPLSDVVNYLIEHHKIPIQLDTKALTNAGLGSDTPVTASFDGISLRSALRFIFGELDLNYVVRNEVLFITSRTEAENLLEFKIYPVRDLVTYNSDFRPAARHGKDFQEDYQDLSELITSTIAPTTWGEVGGPGPRMEFRHAHALSVTQTAEVHEEIAALLAALRLARDKQLKAASAVAQIAGKQPQPAAGESMQVKVYALRHSAAGMGGGIFAVPDDAADADEAAPTQTAPSAAAASPATKGQGASSPSAPVAVAEPSGSQLDNWAKQLAATLPEVITPESWAPRGKGRVWAAAGRLIVYQSETVHRQVLQLLSELGAGFPSSFGGADQPSLRLAVPGPQPDWPQAAEPRASDKEAAIEKALDARLDISFVDTPLSDVISYVEQAAKISVRLDTRALTDAGLGGDTPVTRRLVGLSLRAALRLMLDELDTTYVIRDEVLLITTKVETEKMLTTKVYPVFDLVVRPAGAPPKGLAIDYESLVEIVWFNIATGSWDNGGGPGAIQPFANAGALVVSQTTEAHEEIARYLKALREVGAEQQ
jgi:hypothetical protein